MFQFSRGRTGFVGLLLVHAALFGLPGVARSDTPDRLKARVQELHTKGAQVTVTISDKTVIRGQIVRIAEDSFTLREEKAAGETVVPFARLKDIRKGSSARGKAILIPAAIVGGAVLVLCAAPYPIGFLCHKDPS